MFVERFHGLLNEVLARFRITNDPLIGGLLHVVVLSVLEVLQEHLLLWLDLVVGNIDWLFEVGVDAWEHGKELV